LHDNRAKHSTLSRGKHSPSISTQKHDWLRFLSVIGGYRISVLPKQVYALRADHRDCTPDVLRILAKTRAFNDFRFAVVFAAPSQSPCSAPAWDIVANKTRG